MKLIAVSGGVDSMVLAHLYRNKKVVLAFVNYNLRNDTNIDQQIVEDFAKKYNLKLEKLILKNVDYNGNFQNHAREIRYKFFQSIYQKYNCKSLLVAHHKDDFLETCLMQKAKNEDKLFYGIKQKTKLFNMNIYRPLLFRFWKKDIYTFAQKYKISFNDDSSNFESKYERNKIRNNYLSNLSQAQKEEQLNYFLNINKENEPKILLINNEYNQWKKTKFDTKFFQTLTFKNELIKKFINNHSYEPINLNKNIIDNIIKFIQSNENKKTFILSNRLRIYKQFYKLFIKYIDNE